MANEEIKKVVEQEEKIPEKILIEYKDKEYTLAYSRKTVKAIEGMGYVGEELTRKPQTMVELLFWGAFFRYHHWMTKDMAMEIYETLTDRVNLISTLIKMYNATGDYLFDTDSEDTEKKANWTAM